MLINVKLIVGKTGDLQKKWLSDFVEMNCQEPLKSGFYFGDLLLAGFVCHR